MPINALTFLRTVGWVLLAVSVILFFTSGKAGPPAALHGFYAAIMTQGVVALLLLVLRFKFPDRVGHEVWRYGSPFVLGAILWSLFLVGLYMLNWANR